MSLEETMQDSMDNLTQFAGSVDLDPAWENVMSKMAVVTSQRSFKVNSVYELVLAIRYYDQLKRDARMACCNKE